MAQGSSLSRINLIKLNGAALLTGAGNGGTGSLRINIASDQVSIPVAATLNAETTKAIGVVRNSDGAGNLLTSNSTTTTSKFGLDSNILSILGTAPTTAGKLDIKGADGDVFIRQATASNLNATVVGTGTFAVQATLAAETTKVIGTVNQGTSPWVANATLQTQTDTTMIGGVNIKEINAVTPLMGNGVTGTGSLRVTIASDNTSNTNAFLVAGNKTNNNAAPTATQLGVMPAIANAAAPSWTEGNQVLQSMDLSGNQRVTLGTLLAGEDTTVNVIKVEQRFTYSNITSNTTTTVKSGAGFIHSISINTHGASANTATIYDNTAGSGTKIGTLDTTSGDGKLYDVTFATGLTIVTATGTAADITVNYR